MAKVVIATPGCHVEAHHDGTLAEAERTARRLHKRVSADVSRQAGPALGFQVERPERTTQYPCDADGGLLRP
jgi:hypothetical protein